jgi:hypothetical protein
MTGSTSARSIPLGRPVTADLFDAEPIQTRGKVKLRRRQVTQRDISKTERNEFQIGEENIYIDSMLRVDK